MVEPIEMYREFKEEHGGRKHVVEPGVIAKVREDVKKEYICPFCRASRRADVIYRHDLSSISEVVVEIECRAFVSGKPCGNVDTRYYGR